VSEGIAVKRNFAVIAVSPFWLAIQGQKMADLATGTSRPKGVSPANLTRGQVVV
jgi:hypothetical protein